MDAFLASLTEDQIAIIEMYNKNKLASSSASLTDDQKVRIAENRRVALSKKREREEKHDVEGTEEDIGSLKRVKMEASSTCKKEEVKPVEEEMEEEVVTGRTMSSFTTSMSMTPVSELTDQAKQCISIIGDFISLGVIAGAKRIPTGSSLVINCDGACKGTTSIRIWVASIFF